MANEENLIPYEKGQSGNPKGRPKGSLNKATLVREILDLVLNTENPLTEVTEEMTQAQRMVYAMVKKAVGGDVSAFKELMDSGYGKTADIVHNHNYNDMSEDQLKEELKNMNNEIE